MEQKQYLISQGALASTVALYATVWGARTPILIADRNTWPLVGKKVFEMFHSAGYTNSKKYIFPDEQDVYADYKHL